LIRFYYPERESTTNCTYERGDNEEWFTFHFRHTNRQDVLVIILGTHTMKRFIWKGYKSARNETIPAGLQIQIATVLAAS
jgi:hypothetical protein